MIDYLIIARSGRALAASAKRAGYKVSVIDNFADEDTRSFSESVHQLQYQHDTFDAEELLNHVEEAISCCQNAELVVGSGFEAKPELLDKLVELAPILTNSEASIVAVKNPISFFGMLDKNKILHPEVLFSSPSSSKKYLKKTNGGTGGDHVNWSDKANSKNDSNCYYQAFTFGVVSSAVFLANGTNVNIIGFNQQLQTEVFAEMPFLYQGAIALKQADVAEKDVVEGIVNTITREVGLKGLCGLDYIVNDLGEVFVLEINPRPPATFELHEAHRSLFEAHLASFNGELIECSHHYDDKNKQELRAYAILFAKEKLLISDKIKWPDWVKDRPSFGNVIPEKFPVCTVHAKENTLDKVETMLSNRLQQIESNIIAMQNTA